jgi:hypothetical protein
MMPRLFEAIVCLNENKEWWDLQLVQEMVSKLWDNQLDRDYGAVETYETSYGVADDVDDDGAADW